MSGAAPLAVLRSGIPRNGRYLTDTERQHLAKLGVKAGRAVFVLPDGSPSHGFLWRVQMKIRKMSPVREPLNLAVTLIPSGRQVP